MSSQTANYQLSLREANDIFNPLSTNDNFTKIDELLFKQTMPQYTSVVSANLLTLSGTPSKQDTVFKFIATGSANTWSFGGSIYNIITPDGNQFSTESGKMYVGYVDENNMLVLLAWPSAVNAQTFDNQPSSYYATDSELQAVNSTAANAVQTAQAAQTVANSALETALKGDNWITGWTNPNPSTSFAGQIVQTTIPVTGVKEIRFRYKTYGSATKVLKEVFFGTTDTTAAGGVTGGTYSFIDSYGSGVNVIARSATAVSIENTMRFTFTDCTTTSGSLNAGIIPYDIAYRTV